jgi:hypothetical protein
VRFISREISVFVEQRRRWGIGAWYGRDDTMLQSLIPPSPNVAHMPQGRDRWSSAARSVPAWAGLPAMRLR